MVLRTLLNQYIPLELLMFTEPEQKAIGHSIAYEAMKSVSTEQMMKFDQVCVCTCAHVCTCVLHVCMCMHVCVCTCMSA